MTVTPLMPLIREGNILCAQKAVLLNRGLSEVYLYSVDINNNVERFTFDENGEVIFGHVTPVAVWLSFNQFRYQTTPHIRIVLSGDEIPA